MFWPTQRPSSGYRFRDYCAADVEISSSSLTREVLTVYSMTAMDERCGVLGGIVLLGLCFCQWGRVEWRCAGFLCSSYVWCWRILEQVVLFVGVMSPRS